MTPLSRLLSHGRTFVCDSMPFERMSKARVIPGSTINDVFLCCVAGALRRLLDDMGYDPDQGPLVASIPISSERPEGMEGEGNFVKTDFTWLHIEIEDPLERLAASHASATEMKAHAKAAQGSDITALMQLSPMILTRLIGWFIRRQNGKLGLGGNLAVSNVPGPREPLYLGTMKVKNWFSTGQIFDGTALNITMLGRKYRLVGVVFWVLPRSSFTILNCRSVAIPVTDRISHLPVCQLIQPGLARR